MQAVNTSRIVVKCDTMYSPHEIRGDMALLIENGIIRQIQKVNELSSQDNARVIHIPGAAVAPGFIDLHVHGARGRDLMDGTRESLQVVAESLASHGTTSFLATTLSAPDSDTETAIRGFAEHHVGVQDGAFPLGLHLEGPFLNPLRRGTHSARHLRPASLESYRRFRDISGHHIRKMTVAPEMDEGFRLIRDAVQSGVRISLGHSDATENLARAAVDAGATQATHTFNAMRPFHQREPGILGLVLADDRVFAEIIADGIHVHPTAVQLLFRMKGCHRVLLVTDGLSATDMPDGPYPLGNQWVTVRNGECRDSEGALAGSTLTLERAISNVTRWLNIPLAEALAAASATPALSLGLENRKGTLAPGADADLVFLDQELRVLQTMVGGRIVYRRSA